MSMRIPFLGGYPRGNAGKSPTTNKNKNKSPGPKKLNQAGYGTGKHRKGPPKAW